MLMRRPGGEMRPGRALWLMTRPFFARALNLRVTVPMVQPDSLAQSFAPLSVWFFSVGGVQGLAVVEVPVRCEASAPAVIPARVPGATTAPVTSPPKLPPNTPLTSDASGFAVTPPPRVPPPAGG